MIAATNRNLEEEVGKSQFRSDLYYRLNVLPITMPSLRSHAEDIPLLVEYFIDGFNSEFRKKVLGATPAAYAVLQQYGWPGNVRELRNVIERAMLLSDHDRLDAKDFAALSRPVTAGDEFELPAKGVDLEQLERSLRRPGAQAERRESDARRRAPRIESRPDPLPHREVRADHGALALRARRPCSTTLRQPMSSSGTVRPFAFARSAVEDVDTLREFLISLSSESLYFRFLGICALTRDRVRALVDNPRGTAIAAESGGRVVAFAGFYRDPAHADRAEVAFAVADALQGHGIGTRLLEHLAGLAREQGIRTFDAYVLAGNRRMLDVFRDSGFAMTTANERGVLQVSLSLSVTPAFEAKAATRSQTAATASMKAFFEPRGVAVIGANRERGKIGSEILHNLVAAGFRGPIVPVHPTAPEIEGLRAYPRVADIPDAIDLAVVVVPAAQVQAAVDDCLARGIRAICVISAGFSECDAEGQARERLLLERVREAGCRLIGPNCMGLLNTNPAVRLNATFSPVYPPAGNVAMSTQSGALGLAILDYARRLDIGISSFVSVGNKADVSGNDLIQYWADDPSTGVILLYLESFGNPKKFARSRAASGAPSRSWR